MKTYNYKIWLENIESPDKEESTGLPPMSALEADEVKKEKIIKILIPKKLLTRLPILLAQIKAGNNSKKLRK